MFSLIILKWVFGCWFVPTRILTQSTLCAFLGWRLVSRVPLTPDIFSCHWLGEGLASGLVEWPTLDFHHWSFRLRCLWGMLLLLGLTNDSTLSVPAFPMTVSYFENWLKWGSNNWIFKVEPAELAVLRHWAHIGHRGGPGAGSVQALFLFWVFFPWDILFWIFHGAVMEPRVLCMLDRCSTT